MHLRVHGHGGEFGVDASAGRRCRVAGEGLRRRHAIAPAELQRTAAKHLPDLRQVRLGRYHHAGSLAVQEVLLRRRSGIKTGRPGAASEDGFTLKTLAQYSKEYGLLTS